MVRVGSTCFHMLHLLGWCSKYLMFYLLLLKFYVWVWVCFSGTGTHVAQAAFELMEHKLALNSWFPCFYLSQSLSFLKESSYMHTKLFIFLWVYLNNFQDGSTLDYLFPVGCFFSGSLLLLCYVCHSESLIWYGYLWYLLTICDKVAELSETLWE